ncbi:flagellar biosynthesis anti-sigma factor FlgM [Heyndrickxia oleronia]|uniref:flagellar biosynthesis anti-sigma factor FlgM n=1 Tax=Heyndrickxia oleronia TaxID=38875 RepID=UPI0020415B22|nr:flagellar biosynthesis anti-sigma factor FlgM [Heyndrickxia oleronia]MCM3454377.1 flagellar biosynthesis anti-sigma factor FlgM [Heyndrickxia oleronia]
MKINNYGTHGINTYKKQMNKFEQANKSGKQTDKVEISSKAKDMQTSTIEQARRAKVEQLKIEVQNGQYKVNPELIAKGIKNFYQGK